MSRKQPTPSTKKLLFARSGNLCAFPDCPETITRENKVIGEVCHIEAAEKGGPRYNPYQTDEERRSYENLILLCPNHHEITHDEQNYPVESLKKMKEKHESKFIIDSQGISEHVIKEDRLHYLSSLSKDSLARCIPRWQTIGLSLEQSKQYANDCSIGCPRPNYRTRPDKPLIILVAELGTGKSLLIERLIQEAIEISIEDMCSPLPMYFDGSVYVKGDILKQIKKQSRDLNTVEEQGVTVFIDNTDVLGTELVLQLLDEARQIVNRWPNTSVTLTSRPIGIFEKLEEREDVLPLTPEAVQLLVLQVSDIRIEWQYVKPKSIQTAILRPLFALLYGIYLKEQRGYQPRSIGELLAFLVEHSLGTIGVNKIVSHNSLIKLAVLCIERSGILVPINEFSPSEHQLILESGFIIKKQQSIGFVLPILTEWLAACSLADGNPSPDDLLIDEHNIKKWYYPLIIFVANFEYEQVSAIFNSLTEKFPGIASQILSDAIVWREPDFDTSLSELEYGNRIRSTMRAWSQGIGNLAELIAPLDEMNRLRPLGMIQDEQWITYSWYYGSENLSDLSSLSGAQLPSAEWPRVTSMKLGHQSAWIWKHTHDSLTERLSERLNHRYLPIDTGILVEEKVWNIALLIMGYGSLWPHPISIETLQGKLYDMGVNTIYRNGRRAIYPHDLKLFRAKIDCLLDKNNSSLYPPWPISNTGGFIWEGYSDIQLLKRTIAIYQGAIDSYICLVNKWFDRFKPTLQTWHLLPARFVGKLEISNSSLSGPFGPSGPSMQWYWDPLPDTENSKIDISLEKILKTLNDRSFHTNQRKKLRHLRNDSHKWLDTTLCKTHLDHIFSSSPVTDIVYEWLWDDLSEHSWTTGMLKK